MTEEEFVWAMENFAPELWKALQYEEDDIEEKE